MCLFCIYLRTNSDLCHLQHKLIGFYNRDENCLQRSTSWVIKQSSPPFFFKVLKFISYFLLRLVFNFSSKLHSQRIMHISCSSKPKKFVHKPAYVAYTTFISFLYETKTFAAIKLNVRPSVSPFPAWCQRAKPFVGFS